MSNIKTTKIKIDNDLFYCLTDIDTENSSFKVVDNKVYIPAGEYEYNDVGYVREIKIDDKWYPFDDRCYNK